jgi:hypothetical protein
MTDREIMQQALEALQAVKEAPSKDEIQRAWIVCNLLQKRLAQPEQDAVLAEREACAKLCEELDAMNWSDFGEYKSGYADDIRARGQK